MINLSFARFGSLELPPTRRVELPGGGTTVAYEMAGPPGAPTLFLVHGLVASSYLNWFPEERSPTPPTETGTPAISGRAGSSPRSWR